jgi:hypothetical protein
LLRRETLRFRGPRPAAGPTDTDCLRFAAITDEGIVVALSRGVGAVILFVAVGGLQNRTAIAVFSAAVMAGLVRAFLTRRRAAK